MSAPSRSPGLRPPARVKAPIRKQIGGQNPVEEDRDRSPEPAPFRVERHHDDLAGHQTRLLLPVPLDQIGGPFPGHLVQHLARAAWEHLVRPSYSTLKERMRTDSVLDGACCEWNLARDSSGRGCIRRRDRFLCRCVPSTMRWSRPLRGIAEILRITRSVGCAAIFGYWIK